VKFHGETYGLAWVAENTGPAGAEVINEYLRTTDTLETWTKLIAVRSYANRTDYKRMVAALAQALEQQNPLARYAIMHSPDGKRTCIDFLTWDLNAKVTEFNVFIFRLDCSGTAVISQQFAMRDYGDDRLDFMKRLKDLRPKLLEEVENLEFPEIKREKVEHQSVVTPTETP